MSLQRLPVIVIVISASGWGLFWLPLRAFENNGLTAGWTTLAVFVTPTLLLLPIAIWRVSRGLPSGARRVAAGLLAGGAVALYSESVLRTDVARALLLFYATPIWSTLLEITLLKRPLTTARVCALALGLAGLFTILGARSGVPLPQNPGDALALLAGVIWAFGTIGIRSAPRVGTFETVFAFFLYGSAVAVLIAILASQSARPAPSWETLVRLAPLLVLVSVVFLIPVMWGILWGSKKIDSGRLGILLQLEAVVGIGSAAVFANEPFGFVEGLGTLLVIGAGLVDVLGHRKAGSA